MGKAGIVILNYNGYQDTIECVKSLSVVDYPCIIVVVDNCSAGEDYEQLKNNLPSTVILLKTDRNIGYAAGNNVGLKYAVDHGCDYLCILNNDTFIEEDFLTPCINEIERDCEIGFIGPTLVDYYTGLVQSTGGDIFIAKGKVNRKNSGMILNEVPHYINCDYVGGACIVLKKKLLDEIGYIPESYFLFYEETEWCCRAKKEGYHNICLGYTKIRHKGSASIKKINGLNEYLINRNRIAFIRRNCNSKLWAFLIYLSLIIKSVFQIPRIHENAIKRIRSFYDGWNKKIDLNTYPFIVIKE